MNNSSYGKSNDKAGSINAFDLDLGLGSGAAKSMNDQKNKTSSYPSTTYTYSSAQQKPNTTSSWTHQPNKPAWTHQPATSSRAGSLSGPTSMVDIQGKSWNSSAPSSSSLSGIGIVNNKNPNLFGDLLNSALGQNKSSSNVPLKNAAPAASQNTFSMGAVADSLPKTGYSGKNGGMLGSNVSNSGGNVSIGGNYGKSSNLGVNLGGNNNRNANLGVPSMKSMMAGEVGGGGMGVSTDPFGSLVDFGSKPSGGMNSASKTSGKSDFGNDSFGDFQNAASKTRGFSFSLGAFPASDNDRLGDFGSKPLDGMNSASKPSDNSGFGNDLFGDFQNATSKPSGSSFSSGAFPTRNNDPLGDFGPSNQSPGANDFDALFSSSGGTRGTDELASQQFAEGDDWGLSSEFGGNDTGGTTELEGLPPPPAGVSAPAAKNKGMDNYKQGQFADAIKWLSWAVILLKKAGDDDGTMEVLMCRASCYKEVGEYKKAVADCTKMLEHDDKNVSVLVQRALLYESMEKYKLGAEDLRTVMKLDPGNRLARSTIHRLTKMTADQ